MFQPAHKNIQGFTLIEVLVSTIILAIGLLGLAAMQTIALKDNQDAFFYSQASSLAYEMSDRIKVNSTPWKSLTLPTTLTCNNSCTLAAPCTPADMANMDYCAWKGNVQNRIAAGATATVSVSGTTGVCNGGPTRRCLTITWVRNNKQKTQNATNTFLLETTP